MVPVYKKEPKKNKPEIYRPVALTSITCKILHWNTSSLLAASCGSPIPMFSTEHMFTDLDIYRAPDNTASCWSIKCLFKPSFIACLAKHIEFESFTLAIKSEYFPVTIQGLVDSVRIMWISTKSHGFKSIPPLVLKSEKDLP